VTLNVEERFVAADKSSVVPFTKVIVASVSSVIVCLRLPPARFDGHAELPSMRGDPLSEIGPQLYSTLFHRDDADEGGPLVRFLSLRYFDSKFPTSNAAGFFSFFDLETAIDYLSRSFQIVDFESSIIVSSGCDFFMSAIHGLVDDCKSKRYMTQFWMSRLAAKVKLSPEETDELNRCD